MPLFKRSATIGSTGALQTEPWFVTAARTKTIVIANGQTTDSTKTIYTVPTGKALFIMSAWVAAGAATNTNARYRNSILAGGSTLCACYVSNSQSATTQTNNVGTASISISTVLPVRIAGGQTVSIESGNSSVSTSGGIVGWLENE